ncbi:MAG TPA: phosphoribosylamine--glycine ligase [Thermoanaerobaculia bacterium]|jgi:phosphoribosylamine--glycine ligase|nr:phosphoribosylamine--glycine ligase [Thermoanaerobaculia bacterium]
MRVLVVGSGGREHALCWKLRQSPLLTELYCAPGNPGIAKVADLVPIAAEEVQRLADFATEMKIDLTVVGPELPLTLGLVDELTARGLKVFGPTMRAAELEGSKVFSKEFMQRHGIPTAPFAVVHGAEQAREVRGRFGWPVVIKADGLAAGKGVVIANGEAEYDAAVKELFEDRRFGAAGDRAVIEGFLEGEEVSFMALSDGERVLPLATAKDYKRIGDHDTGPNTGGMGSHSPAGVLSGEAAAEVLEKVLHPTVAGMASEGRPFAGVLYAGLILTKDGPRVLEFNARFGDPECQAILLRLEDDLLPVLAAGARGEFDVRRLSFRKEVSACIVLASPGYPGRPVTGEPIRGLDRAAELPGVEVFHAGTAMKEGELVSAGGRVLSVCATDPDLAGALRKAYAAVERVDWPGKVYRRDIGRRVLEGGERPSAAGS